MGFVYAMSDIHGCLAEFEEALFLAEEHLEEGDVRLVLLGDHIHGGEDSRGVPDSGRIPVLKVDTYYRVTQGGEWPVLPYDEENQEKFRDSP